jgi:hypothetical protein
MKKTVGKFRISIKNRNSLVTPRTLTVLTYDNMSECTRIKILWNPQNNIPKIVLKN